jgi:hypothetical protein
MELNKPTTQVIDQSGQSQMFQTPGLGGVPRSVGTFADVPLPPPVEAQKGRLAKLGAAQTITNVNAFTPASVAAQQKFVDAASDERKVLRNAPDTLANIDAAIKLIPTASTFMGKGGEPLLAAASFLNNRLGFGISTQGVTDATVLRTRLFEGILDNLKKLDSQPSQEQQRVLSEALGNLGTDPAALEQILNRIGETVRSRVDRFNTDVTDAETRGVKFPFTPQIKLPAPKFAPGAAVAQIPGQGPAPAAVSNSVTLPDGRVKTFPNADAANQFKRAAGLYWTTTLLPKNTAAQMLRLPLTTMRLPNNTAVQIRPRHLTLKLAVSGQLASLAHDARRVWLHSLVVRQRRWPT